MSSLLNQITNSIQYSVHKATYDPEANAFAEQQAKEREKEQTRAAQAAADAERTAEQKRKDELVAAAAADAEAERERRAHFSGSRMIGRAFEIIGAIVGVFVLVVFGVLGASLATNLNVYREMPYRILYAVYGFLFFWVVIPYVFGYRWWWNGKKPRFYAMIPIVPYKFTNPIAGMLLGWMSYKPDESIEGLKEWI